MTKSCVATHVFTEKLAMVGKDLDVEQSLCRARSRSTSVGSSPGSDLPSVAASSPDCASAVPVGLPGLLCLDPHEILPKFNLSMLEQNSILDTSAKDVKASPLRICPPPGLEDFCSSTAASTEEGDDDDSFAWVVASSAAEMALDSPTSKLRLRALESDVQHFSSLLRAPRAPVCPPPPPLQPPVFGCAKKSPQFSPPPQPPILATDGLRPVLPPPSWCPSTSAAAERPRIAPPPLQPPFLTVNMNAQPPAPPPLQAPVLGAEVLVPVDVPPPAKAPVLRLAEAFPDSDTQAATLPTVGSTGHYSGTCRPCAFFYTKGCSNGKQCAFCHLCGPGEKKRRMKEKRALLREEGSAPGSF